MTTEALPESRVHTGLGPEGNWTTLEHAAVLRASREWFLPFVKYTMPWYTVDPVHKFVATKLEQFEKDAAAKRSPRLILTMPPRVGKSQLATRHFPGWLLGRHPDWSVGIVSYGAELAEELSGDARRIVMDDPYREIFSDVRYQPEGSDLVELDKTSRAVNFWRIANHSGGVRAVGVGGALTGRGFNVCIIDDPVKGREEADSELERDRLWRWYLGTLRSRLEPGGGLLLISTRWHHDDLVGRLLAAAAEDPQRDQWQVVNLPALAEEDDPLGRELGEPITTRFTMKELETIRANDAREFQAQYMGHPSPDEGDIFNRDWFRIEDVPAARINGQIVPLRWPCFIFMDTAVGKSKKKGDYTVAQVWRWEQTTYRLVWETRARMNYPELKDHLYALAERFSPQLIVVEDASSGSSLIQDLRNERALPIFPWRVGREDKIARAQAVAGIVASGQVALVKGAHWLEAFLSEVTEFPTGRHDDQVDCLSMALSFLSIWQRPKGRIRVHDFAFVNPAEYA